ncbi:MAG TPA: hypothetical protein VHD86_25590, partial [Xanthobacteraceae bacterium]|nr:hypothetical protein [Xanthobacteraceae bacterium]
NTENGCPCSGHTRTHRVRELWCHPMYAVDFALSLLGRTSIAGMILFILPPAGAFPYPWQAGLAFLAWAGWHYWRGFMGRRLFGIALFESIVSLWMSLKWTAVFVAAGGIL